MLKFEYIPEKNIEIWSKHTIKLNINSWWNEQYDNIHLLRRAKCNYVNFIFHLKGLDSLKSFCLSSLKTVQTLKTVSPNILGICSFVLWVLCCKIHQIYDFIKKTLLKIQLQTVGTDRVTLWTLRWSNIWYYKRFGGAPVCFCLLVWSRLWLCWPSKLCDAPSSSQHVEMLSV